MNTEECLEMIKALNNTYQQVARASTPARKDVYKLKHLLTEIDMIMISMRKSIDTMVEKLNIQEQTKREIKIPGKTEK